MKSHLIETRRFIECDCFSPDHLLVVDLLEDDDQTENANIIYLAEIGFLSNYRAPWYKRIYYALNYIFRKKGFYTSDSICISENNIEQLEELVNSIKRQKEIMSNG